MTKKIPLEIKEDEVKAEAKGISVSVKIPKKYRKLVKYAALILSFALIYFGYTLSI